jgi:3-oxoadipate enol-lactonase
MVERLYFVEKGEGIPLICLHGYVLDHTIWLKMADRMKPSIRLILPDLRGHGKSSAPEGKYSMQDMAEDVLKILDNLNLQLLYIAGHSMGGYVALALAEICPERFLGIALVASHTFADSLEKMKSRLEDIEKIKNSLPAEVLKDFPEKLTRDPGVAEFCKELISQTNRNGVMGALAGMAERPDRTNILATLNIPKLLIVGSDDQLIPLENTKEMSLKIKNLQVVEIKNAGHMPMLEYPDQTAIAIENLIR